MAFDPLIFTDDYLRVRAIPTCHTSTFIWCHGKGQQGGDWQFMVEPLRKLGHCNHIAFIFPYLDYSESNKNTVISRNEPLIQKIVHEEIVKGCHPDRIAVGGYSEGLEVALLATLGSRDKIAGILGITDELILSDGIIGLRKPANANTPVCVVDRSEGQGEKVLASLGQPIGSFVHGSKRTTSGLSPISQKELEDLDSFINNVLPVQFARKE